MLLTLILLTLFSSRMAFTLSVLTYVLFSLSLTFALVWEILCVGILVAMGTVVEERILRFPTTREPEAAVT